jgi:hypothetical protein
MPRPKPTVRCTTVTVNKMTTLAASVSAVRVRRALGWFEMAGAVAMEVTLYL